MGLTRLATATRAAIRALGRGLHARSNRVLALALLACLLLAAIDAAGWAWTARENAAIDALEALEQDEGTQTREQRLQALLAIDADADADTGSPALRFARAHALVALGREDLALQRYRALEADTPIGQAARFNSANLLLREALRQRETAEPGRAIPLVELAKEILRALLRAEPMHWNARYNLERAQRLVPDPDATLEAPPEGRRNAERAATTMRGFSPGLP